MADGRVRKCPEPGSEDTLVFEGASYIDVETASEDEELFQAVAAVERKMAEKSEKSAAASSASDGAGAGSVSGVCHGIKRKKSSHNLFQSESETKSHSEQLEAYKVEKFQEFTKGYTVPRKSTTEEPSTRRPFKEFLELRRLRRECESRSASSGTGQSR